MISVTFRRKKFPLHKEGLENLKCKSAAVLAQDVLSDGTGLVYTSSECRTASGFRKAAIVTFWLLF